MPLSNVQHRPNKVAKGFTKHLERNERLGKKRKVSISLEEPAVYVLYKNRNKYKQP